MGTFPETHNDPLADLGVAETTVGSLLCCALVIVQCLFNLLCYAIW